MENAKLRIDLRAIHNNASRVLEETGGGLIAVVKNNAYNFGRSKGLCKHIFKGMYKDERPI